MQTKLVYVRALKTSDHHRLAQLSREAYRRKGELVVGSPNLPRRVYKMDAADPRLDYSFCLSP